MKELTVYLDGGRLIDYQHYIDAGTLPGPEAIRRELKLAFSLEDDLDRLANLVYFKSNLKNAEVENPQPGDSPPFGAMPDAALDTSEPPTRPEPPKRQPGPRPDKRLPGMQHYRYSSVDFDMRDIHPAVPAADPLAAMLAELRPSAFPGMITQLVGKAGFRTYTELCDRAGISTQLFYQLMDHRSEAVPKRENVFRLAFALKASLEEVERLMASKGLAFRTNVRSDVIVRHCFETGVHNPMKVDRLLYRYDCPTLFSEE